MLVAEAGTGPNTGRVSLIDRDARPFSVIDYVLEYSESFLADAPGRLLFVDTVRGTTAVLTRLVTPTHMAFDTRTGDLFVVELSNNRIVRVQLSR